MRLLRLAALFGLIAAFALSAAAEQIVSEDFNDGQLEPFRAGNYGEGEYSVEVVPDLGRDGTACLRLENQSPKASCAAVYTVKYERGRVYTITYWARAAEEQAKVQAYIDAGDWREKFPGGYSPKVTLGEEWQKVTWENLHQQGGRSYAANVKVTGQAPVLVDDIEITASPGKYAVNWALEANGGEASADSTFGGYRLSPINDGLQSLIGSDYTRRATATAETSQPHWVQVTFPNPRPVSKVVIYWAAEGGQIYTSTNFQIQLQVEDEWQTVAEASEMEPEYFSEFTFETQSATAVRVYQKPRGGSQARLNILWVSEVEAY